MASQVAPSVCLNRFTDPIWVKMNMKMNMAPLMPVEVSHPAWPKKHCTPNHQLHIKDRNSIRVSLAGLLEAQWPDSVRNIVNLFKGP